MKLISCYINGFGKLSETSFKFDKNCSIFCHENGFGKSTLAAFIRVMFYGFSGESKRSELENERKRFKPWQGGIYGGNLIFETNGKRYTITRTFGDKDKDDIFELRNTDTNVMSKDFSNRIGEELFQIDLESFKRTVFISQNDCETETNGSINAKLGNLAENTNDINNFEKADERLKDLLNSMTPKRKTGSLNKLKNEMAELELKAKNGEAVDAALANNLEHIEAIKAEQTELRERQTELKAKQQEISIYSDLKAQKEEYGKLCTAYKERETEAARQREFFKGIIPDENELAAYMSSTTRLAALKETVENYRLTEGEQQSLEKSRRILKNNRPSKQKLDECRREISEIHQLRIKIAEDSLTQEEENRLRALDTAFSGGVPSKAEIEERLADCGRREEIKNQLISKETNYNIKKSSMEQSHGKSMNTAGLLFLGIALMVFGVIALFWILPLGIVLLAVGISVTIVSCISGKKHKAEQEIWQKQEDELSALQREIDEDKNLINDIETEAQRFLTSYGAEYRKELVNNILFNLQQDSGEYIRLKNKKTDFENSGVSLQLAEMKKSLEDFFAMFDLTEFAAEKDYSRLLHEIDRLCETEKQLKEKENSFITAENTYKEQFSKIKSYIESISFEPSENLQEQLLEIKRRRQSLDMAMAEFDKAKKEKEQFEREHEDYARLESLASFENSDLTLENIADEAGNITDRLEELQSMLTSYIRRMEQNQEERNNIFEAEALLSEYKEKYASDELKFKRIEKVRELLSEAKEDFTAKYTGPVLDGFKKYYKLLTGSEASGHFIDANIKLTVSEQGLQRDTALFSTGCRDLLGICMRMALVEAMYKEEKPFIIFDDPYTNFDLEKTERGVRLLEEISKEYQIIYFTCHESRSYL